MAGGVGSTASRLQGALYLVYGETTSQLRGVLHLSYGEHCISTAGTVFSTYRAEKQVRVIPAEGRHVGQMWHLSVSVTHGPKVKQAPNLGGILSLSLPFPPIPVHFLHEEVNLNWIVTIT